MPGRGLNSKWKQVLGLENGTRTTLKYSPPLTPPYSPILSPQYSLNSYSTAPDWEIEPTFQTPASQTTFPRIPRDITFTRTGLQDVLLSPTSPAPSPKDIKPLPDPPALFYITSQHDSTSESSFTLLTPDLALHSGPSKLNNIISFVSFHAVSLVADITLCPLPPLTPSPLRPWSSRPTTPPPNFSFPTTTTSHRYGRSLGSAKPQFKTETLTPTGGIFTTEKYAFYLTLPRTSVREKFEWRHSAGPFVRTVDGIRETGGLKLVRTITGETVAVYAGLGLSSRTKNPRRVVGMFRFLGERLGEEFDVFAVMSILAIVEKGRRTMDANRVSLAR